jgi:hypothetical protein
MDRHQYQRQSFLTRTQTSQSTLFRDQASIDLGGRIRALKIRPPKTASPVLKMRLEAAEKARTKQASHTIPHSQSLTLKPLIPSFVLAYSRPPTSPSLGSKTQNITPCTAAKQLEELRRSSHECPSRMYVARNDPDTDAFVSALCTNQPTSSIIITHSKVQRTRTLRVAPPSLRYRPHDDRMRRYEARRIQSRHTQLGCLIW